MTDELVCQHCFHSPTFKRRELQQQPYRGLWQALVGRVADLDRDTPVYRRDLDRWLAELWNEQPGGQAVFALNTTRYGREVDEPPTAKA